MKAGYKTTEFWLTVIGSIWAAVAPGLAPEVQAAVPAIAGAVYTIARTIAKWRASA